MAKVFISHSSKDKAFAVELQRRLESRGHGAWLDTSELLVGDEIRAKIDEGIGFCDVVLFVLSPDAIQSQWLHYELRVAQIPDGSGKKKPLWPVLLRQCEKIPVDLEGLKFADFRGGVEQGWRELEQGLSRWERQQQPASTQQPVNKTEPPRSPVPVPRASRHDTLEQRLLASASSVDRAIDARRQPPEAHSAGSAKGPDRSKKGHPPSVSAIRVAAAVLIVGGLGLTLGSNREPRPSGAPAPRSKSILLQLVEALGGGNRATDDNPPTLAPTGPKGPRSTRAVGGDTNSLSELRNQHRVRPIQDTEVASSVENIPAGVLGFVEMDSLRLLRRAPVNSKQSDTAFEVHKTAAGELLVVGYVGESEFAGAASGQPFKISVAPRINPWAGRLISIPMDRMKGVVATRDNAGNPFVGLTLGSASLAR